MRQLVIEAVVVGLTLIVIGNVVSVFVAKCCKVDLPKICNTWNKFYAMEVSLFLTGVVTHLLFEWLGVNKYYCKMGYACRR